MMISDLLMTEVMISDLLMTEVRKANCMAVLSHIIRLKSSGNQNKMYLQSLIVYVISDIR